MMRIISCFGNTIASGKEGVYVEKYLYEALPTAGESEKKETVEMEMLHAAGSITYHSKISSSRSSEEIRIETDGEGQFISGNRQVLSYGKDLPA